MLNHLITRIREAGIDIQLMTPEQEARLSSLKNLSGQNIDYQLLSTDNWFYSNAEKAVRNISQDKATPAQWLAMLTKAGGIKSGEDRWLGLSDWLRSSQVRTLTRDDLLRYIDANRITLHEDYYGELETLPEFEKLNKEFRELIESSDELWKAADREYQSFVEEMEVKYGEDWLYEMREDERDMQQNLLDARDNYDAGVYDQHERAYEEMVNRHGSRFENSFGWDGDSLTVGDDETASRFLGVGIIDETRLDHTTQGLTQYHELAFWTENTESWNANDLIHFGEVGQGKCIGWCRFGVTYHRQQLTEEEWLQRVAAKPGADAWTKMDGSNFVGGNDVYYPPGKDRYSSEYIAATRDGSSFIYHSRLNRSGVSCASLSEAVDMYNRDNTSRYEFQNVLVIDEIQSRRHQQGRDKGYAMTAAEKEAVTADYIRTLKQKTDFENHLRTKYNSEMFGMYINDEEMQKLGEFSKEITRLNGLSIKDGDKVPRAPFEKNWHELCMKRMLRYAAEHGFQKVAWTKGEQQLKRYDVGKVLHSVTRDKDWDQDRYILIHYKPNSETGFYVKPDGKIYDSILGWDGKHINAVFGKELADKVMNLEVGEKLDAKDMSVGNAGLRTFYDNLLPQFVSSYVRRWGAQLGEISFPQLDEANDMDGGRLVMHCVDVTPEMSRSVMQGQPMFMHGRQGQMLGCTVGDTIYLTPKGLNTDTLVHEYTHVWVKAMQHRNPEGWQSVKDLLRDTPLWDEVVNDPLYRQLGGDGDRIASEALARISGRANAARLDRFSRDGEMSSSILEKLQQALQTFWSWVARNLFDIKQFHSVSEVTDRILHDLLNATRLTDVRVYSGRDGNTYIRCKIDGQQQLAKPVKAQEIEDMSLLQQDADALKRFAHSMAVNHFSAELKQDNVLGQSESIRL